MLLDAGGAVREPAQISAALFAFGQVCSRAGPSWFGQGAIEVAA